MDEPISKYRTYTEVMKPSEVILGLNFGIGLGTTGSSSLITHSESRS